ncbi:MAG TPA: hypothetical protein VJ011_09320 [Steroidobacteraceae bacterium]|nr:hypothetical protein [Steroidobacteraceae bacterium]
MGTQVGKWLGSILTRLATGSIPADGFYALGGEARSTERQPQRPVRSRHFGVACGDTPAPGQTQFIRGLC